jgi:hypothetical protein
MSSAPSLAPVLASSAAAIAADDRFVDDRDLERLTPIKRVTWQHMRTRGEGPAFHRVGRRCIYKWSEVLRWIEQRRVGGGS